MINLVRTDAANKDFEKLVIELDALLRILDGDEHQFYAQLNKVDMIKHAIVAYEDGIPVGCGAIRKYSDDTVEVKRMYVLTDQRKKGIASNILGELENWAKEMHFSTCILETGVRQVEAIHLYKKCGYQVIKNYGKYLQVANSVCFEKKL